MSVTQLSTFNQVINIEQREREVFFLQVKAQKISKKIKRKRAPKGQPNAYASHLKSTVEPKKKKRKEINREAYKI